MNYWEGAGGSANKCACRVTNSCLNGQKCNCYNSGSGWREDSGLLTDTPALLVSQIRLADLNDPSEEGYHTLGKLKCEISVNSFGSLRSKRVRAFFFSLLRNQTETLATQTIFSDT